MQIISTTGLITINATLIVQVISFLILLFVLNRIMFRPLRVTMSRRDAHLEKIQNDIIQRKNELTDLEKKIHAGELAARHEAFEVKIKLENSGMQQAAEIIGETRNEIDAHKKKAHREVKAQLENAKNNLQRESENLALAIMEKILERRLSQ